VTRLGTGPLIKLCAISSRGEGFISPLLHFYIDPRDLLAAYSVPTAGLVFPGVERPGRDTEHLHPPGAEVNYDPPPKDTYASYSNLYGSRIFPLHNETNYLLVVKQKP